MAQIKITEKRRNKISKILQRSGIDVFPKLERSSLMALPVLFLSYSG